MKKDTAIPAGSTMEPPKESTINNFLLAGKIPSAGTAAWGSRFICAFPVVWFRPE